MERYIVFLKQVPRSTKVGIDPVTKTLKRSSSMTRTNPDDLCALQVALDLKVETGAEVVAVSMGPASAESVLREALQLGADRAVLLSSPAFAGSDTFCTSVALSAAARKIGFDMLFFGRMAIDGDTAQVGPEVAGMLGIPQVTYIVEAKTPVDGRVEVVKEAGDTLQRLSVALPCAVMVGKEFSVNPPTLAGWRRAQGMEIVRWNETDLDLDGTEVGLNASPTKVVETEVAESRKDTCWIADGEALAAAFRKCLGTVEELKEEEKWTI